MSNSSSTTGSPRPPFSSDYMTHSYGTHMPMMHGYLPQMVQDPRHAGMLMAADLSHMMGTMALPYSGLRPNGYYVSEDYLLSHYQGPAAHLNMHTNMHVDRAGHQGPRVYHHTSPGGPTLQPRPGVVPAGSPAPHSGASCPKAGPSAPVPAPPRNPSPPQHVPPAAGLRGGGPASDSVSQAGTVDTDVTMGAPSPPREQFAKIKGSPPPIRAELDDASSSSLCSPGRESPSQACKSKIEVKLSQDGQLLFNARQRRTLRRALQRQRMLELGQTFDAIADGKLSDVDKQIVVDVVRLHIGRPLPEGTNVEELVRILLSLGAGEAGMDA